MDTRSGCALTLHETKESIKKEIEQSEPEFGAEQTQEQKEGKKGRREWKKLNISTISARLRLFLRSAQVTRRALLPIVFQTQRSQTDSVPQSPDRPAAVSLTIVPQQQDQKLEREEDSDSDSVASEIGSDVSEKEGRSSFDSAFSYSSSLAFSCAFSSRTTISMDPICSASSPNMGRLDRGQPTPTDSEDNSGSGTDDSSTRTSRNGEWRLGNGEKLQRRKGKQEQARPVMARPATRRFSYTVDLADSPVYARPCLKSLPEPIQLYHSVQMYHCKSPPPLPWR